MSSNETLTDKLISAEHLRRYAGISRARFEKKINANSDTNERALEEQRKLFLESQFLEPESEALKLKIIEAAKQGKYEVEVIRFPSDFCTDGGRAINNSESDWPQTLQGKARNFYTMWKEHGHPRGYHLKARINDYPRGLIGDVSLYIDWS